MRACRICLTKNDLSPLFGELSAVRFSSKQLFVATGVQIHPNDGFPQHACSSCINLIKKSLHLRTISNQANVNLKEILQKSLIKNEENDNDIFNNDFSDYDQSDNFYLVKTEDVDKNDNSDNYMIDVPINTKNKYENKGLRKKRKLRKRRKNVKNIFINDFESNDSDCDDFTKDSSVKIEDYESNSEIDNEIDKDFNSKCERNHSIDDKQDQNDYHTDKLKEIDASSNDANDKLKIKYNRKSNSRLWNDENHKCNRNDNDIKLNDTNIDKLENNDTSVKISKKSVFVLNNKDFYDISKLKYKKRENFGQKKKNAFKDFKKLCRSYVERKPKPFFCGNEKYNNIAGKVNGDYVTCKECKKYVKRSSFVTHASRHFEPEFACEHCGRRFRSKAHMVYHQQRLHGKLKRLACNKCEYRTVHRDDLINHDRITHTGEKPFICDVCKATFPLKRNIVQHMRSHFGVKNVQCEMCSKMFKCKSRLWSHQHRTHFDNYHYHCYLCTEKFRCNETVKRHLLNIHGVPIDQQLRIKYVRTKRLTEGLQNQEEIFIPSRQYVKNIELSTKIPGFSS